MLAAQIFSRYLPKQTLKDCFQLLLSEVHCEHVCFAGVKNVRYGGREMNSNFSLCYCFNYIQIEKTY